VHRQLVGEVAPLGDLDRVDIADEVGYGDVGGGKLLGEARVPGLPPLAEQNEVVPASTAVSSAGSTVSPNPCSPSTIGRPSRNRAAALAATSAWTLRSG
jgi:hypothetical protein